MFPRLTAHASGPVEANEHITDLVEQPSIWSLVVELPGKQTYLANHPMKNEGVDDLDGKIWRNPLDVNDFTGKISEHHPEMEVFMGNP